MDMAGIWVFPIESEVLDLIHQDTFPISQYSSIITLDLKEKIQGV